MKRKRYRMYVPENRWKVRTGDSACVDDWSQSCLPEIAVGQDVMPRYWQRPCWRLRGPAEAG